MGALREPRRRSFSFGKLCPRRASIAWYHLTPSSEGSDDGANITFLHCLNSHFLYVALSYISIPHLDTDPRTERISCPNPAISRHLITILFSKVTFYLVSHRNAKSSQISSQKLRPQGMNIALPSEVWIELRGGAVGSAKEVVKVGPLAEFPIFLSSCPFFLFLYIRTRPILNSS